MNSKFITSCYAFNGSILTMGIEWSRVPNANCIEVSLGRASYSLWTNLEKGKSGVSR